MIYNADNLRVEKQSSAGTAKFIWNGQAYLLETNESGVTQATYTNEPTQYGNLISQRRGATTKYYDYDGLGSTRELISSGEATTDAYIYNAFGELVTSSGSTVNPFRFVGQLGYYFDTEMSDYYVRARTYQPLTGRWWSVDPIGLIGGTNFYIYSANSPMNLFDASGLITFDKEYTMDEQKCIASIVQGIEQALDLASRAERNCFFQQRNNINEAKCVGQLMECAKKAIKNLRFICKPVDIKCGNRAWLNANTDCMRSKKLALSHNCEQKPVNCKECDADPIDTDPTCNLCKYGQSPINICIGPQGALPKRSSSLNLGVWCSYSNNRTARNREDLTRTIVHEIMHLCVGAHHSTEGDTDKCGRPGADSLASRFINNCIEFTRIR
jgi:RHS repeat-associated protein